MFITFRAVITKILRTRPAFNIKRRGQIFPERRSRPHLHSLDVARLPVVPLERRKVDPHLQIVLKERELEGYNGGIVILSQTPNLELVRGSLVDSPRPLRVHLLLRLFQLEHLQVKLFPERGRVGRSVIELSGLRQALDRVQPLQKEAPQNRGDWGMSEIRH